MTLNNKKNKRFNTFSLLGWCLFDFSNAIPAVIGGIYFSKWFIEDIRGGTVLFNVLFFISTLILISTGKIVGKNIDRKGYRFWTKFASALSFIAVLSLYLETRLHNNPCIIIFSFSFFLVYLFGYQISRICHNSYLHKTIPEVLQSKMSGYGTAANWVGSIVGILITIPLINTQPGVVGRENTFLLAAIVYGVLIIISIGLMFLTKMDSNNTQLGSENRVRLIDVFRSTGVIMLAYLFLFDVMATVQRNLPPYLSEIIKMPDNIQSIGFLIILISATVGGFFSSKYVNKQNAIVWLKITSLFLALAILLILIKSKLILWGAFVVAGICYGVLESAIRLNFMTTFTSDRAGENFGMLTIVERTSGVLGPLLWIVPFLVLQKNQAYSAAFITMSLFTTAAFLFMLLPKGGFKVKRK